MWGGAIVLVIFNRILCPYVNCSQGLMFLCLKNKGNYREVVLVSLVASDNALITSLPRVYQKCGTYAVLPGGQHLNNHGSPRSGGPGGRECNNRASGGGYTRSLEVCSHSGLFQRHFCTLMAHHGPPLRGVPGLFRYCPLGKSLNPPCVV